MQSLLTSRLRTWLPAAAAFLLAASSARADVDYSAQTAQSGPPWLRDAVIYEVFPRHFSAAGDLNGVTARLDELKELGVTILWIMPVHPIGVKARKGPLGSPYSIRDYYAINPDYGTLDDFKKLVAETHKRGMKLIMDLVANHTAWDSVLMQHPEYYKRDEHGKVLPPDPGWTDVAGLDYSNPKLREYMIRMMKYWVGECGVDGFRCDVAWMVPNDFWVEARMAVAQVKPDVLWLAEASKPELLVKAFDIDYSWPLLGALNDVMINGAPAKRLQASFEESLSQFPRGSLHLRVSDNHDEARAVARYGINGALAASALMFTLDGVPLLYNGMEAGDATESGDPALFEKVPIYWNPKGRPPLRGIYRDLIRIRKKHAALRDGTVRWLMNSDDKNLLTYLRSDATEEFLVAINFSSRPMTGSVNVENPEAFKPVAISGLSDRFPTALPHLRLHGYGWRIYHRALPRVQANTDS